MTDAELLRVLKAIADPRRFRMVREVALAGELSCGQIGERFSLSQPTISHHLKILFEAGVFQVRGEAQHHFVSVNAAVIREVVGLLPERLDPSPNALRAERRARSSGSNEA
jgi:ArsR family transcriptional regulator